MSVDFVIAISSNSVLFVILDGLKALVPDLQQHGVLLISYKEVVKNQLWEASAVKEVTCLQLRSWESCQKP